MFLDVLEHMKCPERLLQATKGVLEEDGQVIVSLPNIANITVRLMLLFGRFSYTERGILDRTHLRFFTRKSAREMLRSNGFEILDEKVTNMPLELLLPLTPHHPIMRAINEILMVLTRAFRGLLGYQFVFVIAPKREAHFCREHV